MVDVLLVEDQPEMLDSLCEALEIEGFTVHRARDGIEGLSQAQRLQPDIIVTDLKMPKMDGYVLVHELRQDVTTAHIPIVVMSGNAMRDTRGHTEQLGVDGFLSKPFRMLELINTVRDLTSGA